MAIAIVEGTREGSELKMGVGGVGRGLLDMVRFELKPEELWDLEAVGGDS